MTSKRRKMHDLNNNRNMIITRSNSRLIDTSSPSSSSSSSVIPSTSSSLSSSLQITNQQSSSHQTIDLTSNLTLNINSFNNIRPNSIDDDSTIATTTTTTTTITSTSLLNLNQTELFKTNHSNTLLNRLNSMRYDETLCDYEIKCNERSFHCHKFILIAMSDFFRTMLTSSKMKESRLNYVDLKGFSSSNGLKTIIDYFYTGSISISLENILNILEISSHLQIADILNICSEYLIKILTVLNCVSILKLAETFTLKNVIQSSRQFLCDNIVEIYQNAYDQFSQLSIEQLKYLLNNDCLQICSELDLFLMIVKWIEASANTNTSINTDKYSPTKTDSDGSISVTQNERLKYAPELIKSIRFMCMSAEELADYVEPVDFMRNIPECNVYLMDAYRYHALPKRQPLINSEQSKLRNQEMLLAVGETSLFVLNEIKQKWEVVCSAPLDENYPYPFSVITYNNYLYVLGSRRSSSEEYRSCFRFSPRTLEWTQLAPLLHDRSRFGATIIDNFIYIFGGFEGFKRSNRIYLNTIERYSIEDDRWEEFSNDGPMMSSMASCSYNDVIYFGGGKNVNWSKIPDFYSIDVKTKSITKKANMLIARTTHQIIEVNGLIYVYGGFDDAGNGILSIESYDVKTDQWSLVTSAPGSISKTWPQSLGFINGKFYISVFHTPNTFKIMQKGYYYDIEANIWSEAPVINERARYCPTCCLAFPRKIYKFDDNDAPINHNSSTKNSTSNDSLFLDDKSLIEGLNDSP